MPKKKTKSNKKEYSGPINLPTRTLLLIGVLFAITAFSMVFYPDYWFSSYKQEGCEAKTIRLCYAGTYGADPWIDSSFETYMQNTDLEVINWEQRYDAEVEEHCFALECKSGIIYSIEVPLADKDKWPLFEPCE